MASFISYMHHKKFLAVNNAKQKVWFSQLTFLMSEKQNKTNPNSTE